MFSYCVQAEDVDKVFTIMSKREIHQRFVNTCKMFDEIHWLVGSLRVSISAPRSLVVGWDLGKNDSEILDLQKFPIFVKSLSVKSPFILVREMDVI